MQVALGDIRGRDERRRRRRGESHQRGERAVDSMAIGLK
jgi:hypothetical protein